MKIIGTDLDHCIFDGLMQSYLKNFNYRKGTNYTFENLIDYDIEKSCPCTRKEKIQTFESIDIKNSLYLTDENIPNIFREFKKEGYEISIVTASIKKNYIIKKELLNDLNIIYDNIFRVKNGFSGAKKEYAKDCEWFIEDNPYEINELVKINPNIIVFDQPWNRHLPDSIKRAHNWTEVKSYVLG